MDFAGLAALLAIPVSVVASIAAPIRERSLVSRLQRIEKLLNEGSVGHPQREMLENARDHLAERIAGSELQPRLVEFLWAGAMLCIVGVGIAAWMLLDPTFDADPLAGVYRITGWITYGLGLVSLAARPLMRSRWLAKHRATNYRTDDSAFL